jgi:hypothetical protein
MMKYYELTSPFFSYVIINLCISQFLIFLMLLVIGYIIAAGINHILLTIWLCPLKNWLLHKIRCFHYFLMMGKHKKKEIFFCAVDWKKNLWRHLNFIPSALSLWLQFNVLMKTYLVRSKTLIKTSTNMFCKDNCSFSLLPLLSHMYACMCARLHAHIIIYMYI